MNRSHAIIATLVIICAAQIAAFRPLQPPLNEQQRAANAIRGDYSANKENVQRISESFTKKLADEQYEYQKKIRDIEHQSKMRKLQMQIETTDAQRQLKRDIEKVNEKYAR